MRHYRMTPGQFAALAPSDQSWMLGYEIYRRRQLDTWRQILAGDEHAKSNYTPEAATLLRLEGL